MVLYYLYSTNETHTHTHIYIYIQYGALFSNNMGASPVSSVLTSSARLAALVSVITMDRLSQDSVQVLLQCCFGLRYQMEFDSEFVGHDHHTY